VRRETTAARAAELRSFDLRLRTASIGGNAFLVSAAGDLDSHSLTALGTALEVLAPERPGTVIVDLSAVAFLDLEALRVLLGHSAVLRAGGGALVVAADNPQTRRAIELAGLAEELGLCGTLKEALAGARARNGHA
jgi:anti-anti-sigma factor